MSHSRLQARLSDKPAIAPHVVKANRHQTLDGGYLKEFTWGDSWRIGTRRGRWVIGVNSILETNLVRVEWDAAMPPKSDWEFSRDLWDAIFEPPEQDVADARERALTAAAEFDKLAMELWERRDHD